MTTPGRPRSGFKSLRPLADVVNRAVDPLVARQGFGESSLLLQWETIIGARVSGMCQPIKLQWPPRAKKTAPDKAQEPATLLLRVEPGFGLDIQHMSGAIIDRVNTHLGWRCVAKLALRQEPLHRPAPRQKRAPPKDLQARVRAEGLTNGVENEALRAALTTLGERVIANKTRC